MTRAGIQRLTRKVRMHGRTRVFDLTVGEPHAFFADGLLVHNKSVSSDFGGYTYNASQASAQALDTALASELERVRRCVPGHIQVISVRIAHRGLLGLSVPGTSEDAANAARACINHVLAPIAESMPPTERYSRTWRYDLRRPSGAGPVVPRRAAETRKWPSTQAEPLTRCFNAIALTVGSARLYLRFGRHSHLAILEVRDANGIPVDGRAREQRETFRQCVTNVLHPEAWPGFAEGPAAYAITAKLGIHKGKVTWGELSRESVHERDFD